MNSKSLRRLAADHASLHNNGLPPNYLFPAGADTLPDELTHLIVLLTGPAGTPYGSGLWRLHLQIPPTYPNAPPTAFFKTRIWHPNVEESTGAVCVDTLKRDWESKLTLRDVLVTISCLLIQPNPASALNAEAGSLLQDDYAAFERRAKLMTGIHAPVPKELRAAVDEARMRGEDKDPQDGRSQDKAKAVSMKAMGKMKKRSLSQMEEGENAGLAITGAFTGQRASLVDAKAQLNAGDVLEVSIGANASVETIDLHQPAASSSQRPRLSEPLGATNANAQSGPSFDTTSRFTSSRYRSATRIDIDTATQPAVQDRSASAKATASDLLLGESPRTGTFEFHGLSSEVPIRPSAMLIKWQPEQPSTAEAIKQARREQRTLQAAGGCLRRYNRGDFGPRKGLKRL